MLILGIFFLFFLVEGPLCQLMTEWERSHDDKERETGRERKQIKGEGRREL